MIYRDRVQKLKEALEARIVGKERPSMSCGCGAISHGPSKAIAVCPSGDYVRDDGVQCEYQVDMPLMWTVEMDANYSVGLTQFLPKGEIEQLFAEYRPLFVREVTQ